jgi:hypothetical protein
MRAKRFLVSIAATVVLALGVGAPSAFAQQQQDGLVNIIIGDITIRDVNVGIAANVAAAVCAQDVNILAVDQGQGDVVCDIGRSRQEIRFTQN